MTTFASNGSTTRTTNARKGTRGPRPIQTVAQLKENLLRDALEERLKRHRTEVSGRPAADRDLPGRYRPVRDRPRHRG